MKYLNKLSMFMKDWRTYYKLFFFAIIMFALLYSLIRGIVDIKTIKDSNDELMWQIQGTDRFDYSSYVVYYFSFFTNQSNIIVVAWLFMALFFPWKEGKSKFLGTMGSTLTATYISITALIFCFMLLPEGLASGNIHWNAGVWVSNVILHMLGPIGLVLYVVLFMNKGKGYETKKWFTNFSWATFVYPLVYGVYILIRGELRRGSGALESTQYPYFFFHIHDSSIAGMPGPAWFIIAIIIIFAIGAGFSTLYIYASNKVGNKYSTKLNEKRA